MDQLIHLIYSSAATRPFSSEELVALLKRARDNNERAGVTGMLLYSGETFFQVLEGGESVVDALYARIRRDSRHRQAVAIIREPIAKRTFQEWSMGYASLDTDDVKELPGLNDFFARGTCFTSLTSGRAKKLLSAFANGRWRARIRGSSALHPVSAGR